MTKYILCDTLNTYMRSRHMAPRRADMWTKIGFAMHTTLSIVNKSFQKEKADHVVFCTEGRSWRKEVYEPYKRNRQEVRDNMTESEAEEDKEFMEAFIEMLDYLREQTNCTVMRNPIAEADDLIARWIHNHPNDEHVIMSSDSDFIQLISENVSMYNGIQNHLITHEGVFDDQGRLVKDKKTGEPKEVPDPKWALFEKCMRGDTSDNIFSAYPGVRKKGTKNKVGLLEAFADIDNRGYNWNNLMLQRWTDHKDVEHRVIDDYTRNVELIDLTAQPEEIKEYIDETITEHKVAKNKPHVGRFFLRFCGKYDLVKLSEYSTQYTQWLGADYHE